MLNCIAVGLGGFLGSVLRYLVGLLPVKAGNGFPVTTLIINFTGTFVLSAVASFAAGRTGISPRMIMFLKLGLCGGFTTFSTFAYEATKLLTGGHTGMGLLYMLLSVLLGTLAVILGQLAVG